MKSQLARFGSVGVLNTALDFLIFALLTNVAGLHYVAANTISTGSALGLSFFLNGKLTFRTKLTRRNALLFLVITLMGLWVLQPLVIAVTEPLLRPLLTDIEFKEASLLAAKIIATAFSLTWNFLLYKFIVFPVKTSSVER